MAVMRLRPMFRRAAHLAAFGALFVATATGLQAQAPLDIRVLNERIDTLERRLQAVQSGTGQIQMPVSPAEAGIDAGDGSLPADVASRLQVRVLQLERLVESLTGQVERSQFETAQMRSDLRQLSNDVSNRLAVLEQAVGVSAAVAMQPGLPQTPVAMAPSALPPQPNLQPQQAAGVDASRVEPDMDMPMSMPVQRQPQVGAQTPAAPGSKPQAIQMPGAPQTAPITPGPVNQGSTFGVLRTDESGQALPPAPGSATEPPPPQQLLDAPPPTIAAAPSGGPVASQRIGIAPSAPALELTALPEGTPQEQYDYAFDILRRADYGRAEKALRLFLDENSDHSLAGNAQYWLGETFYVRGDFEQAAVEFLSGYQSYPDSSKASDNLLKLGLSMARLGQTDGACTALTRLSTEYPSANDTIRRRAQTERARLSCS